jgi:thiosulfate dehydrogenase
MGRFLLGLFVGVLILPGALFAWFKYGQVPVAVADPPLPEERLITSVPLSARLERDMVRTPPIQPNEENLIAGAKIYHQECAVCHGIHTRPSSIGPHMYPGAPPLWEKHRNGAVVGVSDDPPGETYWKVANGIRLTGMPSYKLSLSDNQMWQVSLLLANADKPLPPAAFDILTNRQTGAPAPEDAPEVTK